jgi:Flp pilus assembly protein TadD
MMPRASPIRRLWLPLAAAVLLIAAVAVMVGGFGEPPAPDKPSALYRFAAAERRLDSDPARAVEDCRELLRDAPDYPGAHLLLGAALMKLGRHGEAEPALRRALALDADDPDVHWLLGNVVLRTRGASAAAVTEAGEHLLRAAALDKGAELPPAADLLRKQLAPYPELIDLRYRLGMTLLQQGNAIDAMWDFRDVAALDPSHEGARRGLEDVRRVMRGGRKAGE